MRLKIFQTGHAVLRQQAEPLDVSTIRAARTQLLIELMRETMRDAPGVGLAAPQVGESLQLAVIEDRAELMAGLPPGRLTKVTGMADRRPASLRTSRVPASWSMVPATMNRVPLNSECAIR